ncbi:MAG: hypothetical protein KatS3mg109_0407 [Pirellulaceae bacterium]|nr:MAG: hypothetical protein KatS3mg109_0407 [Pirellulaceae bacterium]
MKVYQVKMPFFRYESPLFLRREDAEAFRQALLADKQWWIARGLPPSGLGGETHGAASRGDTTIATRLPEGAAWQCPLRTVDGEGLCWRHLKRASGQTVARARELINAKQNGQSNREAE